MTDGAITTTYAQKKIDSDAVKKALATLKEYKDGKTTLEQRIIDSQKWYKMRYYKDIADANSTNEKASAWLFNSIMNKHADTMDNLPEANILPREKSDTETAKILSSIVPVVLERNDFEKTYSDNDIAKVKHGTGVYGVFWDSSKLNGLGDISVRSIDLLNLFWQPGIKDIQQSPNLFLVELIDNEYLSDTYPQIKNKLGVDTIDIKKYVYDDYVDTTKKTPVIDWYYKVKSNGKTILHYAKICAETVLYSSEDSDTYAERGFYDHGEYPFIFDVLFPDEGTPTGFGYIDIMQGAQTQIDMLDDNIIRYSKLASTPRYFINAAGSLNEDEFADWTKPLIHVNGSNLGTDCLRIVEIPELPSIYESIRINKIDELKDTSANKDFSQGGTSAGVTAASAIAALQEAGSKQSRDRIKGNYRAYKKVCELCIELIRQFYDQPRTFRIIAPNGDVGFTDFNNQELKPQTQDAFGVDLGLRKPIFDIDITVQKSSPYAKQVQNELALQFYNMGFFNPQNSDVALATLSMMDFNGKENVVDTIKQNGTMYDKLMQTMQTVEKLASIVDAQNGTNIAQQVIAENDGQSIPAQAGKAEIQSTSPSLTDKAKSRVADSTSPK